MRLTEPLLTLIAMVAALALSAAPLRAQNDRIIDTPTGWSYLYGASSAAIATQIGAGQRPFSIKHVGNLTYDVIFVTNSGPYAVSGTAVSYNRTPTQLADYLNTNNRRILDLTVYDNGSGATRMTAITVPNSGSTHTPAWGWLYNTSFTAIATWMSQNPSLRLIDLDVYRIGGTTYYSAVAVHNSGNNQQGWWYYNGITSTQVSQFLTQNNARLVHIEVASVGIPGFSTTTFACIMVSSNPGGGWWYPSLTTTQVTNLLAQNGARLTALTRYEVPILGTRWAVAMVDNVNAQTRRVREYIDSSLPDGTYGFRLKQVGGPVLASLNENFVYEPASMLKILHAAYAIRMCSLGNDNLTNLVAVTNSCTSATWRNACPEPWPNCGPGNLTLSTALLHMMQWSHNSQTRVVEERYGRNVLNFFASVNAGPNTQINHTMGCGPMTNTMTATEAVALYERIANGTLFNTAWRDELFWHMISLRNGNGWGNYPTLSAVVNQEAAATSLTPGELASFRSAMRYANKGGGYGWNNLFYRTEGAWASIPFRQNVGGNWTTVPREYALSTFVHGSSHETGSTIVYSAKEEILREQIRAALLSWEAACDAPTVTSQPQPVEAPLGGNAAFHASVVGSNYSRLFQWQREVSFGTFVVFQNIQNEPGRFSGVNGLSLQIQNIQPEDARRYRLRITNRCGSVNSSTARLTISESCYANCDQSVIPPILNVDDFTCFINEFAIAQNLPHSQQISHYANCDGSTLAPVLNVDDFTCFINAFAAGCP